MYVFKSIPIIVFSIYLFENCVKANDLKIKKKCNDCLNNNLSKNQNDFNKTNIENKEIYSMESINEKLQAIEKSFSNFKNFQTNIYTNLSPIETNLKRSAFDFLNSLNLTKDCFSAVFRLIDGMKRGELWAYQFFDSMGRVPSGLSEGVISSFGEYDECLAISSQSTDEGKSDETIYGKYCLVKPIVPINDFKNLQNFKGIQFLNNKTNEWIKKEIKENINKIKLLMSANQITNKLYAFYLGICIPSQCQPKDVENILKSGLSKFNNKIFIRKINKITSKIVIEPIIPIPIDVGPKCDTINDRIQWNSFKALIFIIPITLMVLAIVSTIYSLKYQNSIQEKNVYFHEIMKSFSLIESNKRLFSPIKTRILIVDLLMLWVVFWSSSAIAYSAMVGSGSVGYKKLFSSYAIHVLTKVKYFWLRTPFPRDSIFLISGIIISTESFSKTIPNTFSAYFKFILSNWSRFLPKMLGSIFIFNILTNIGDGPIFSMESSKNICPEGLWKNILFVHQFVYDMYDMCVPGSWAYSAVFQLYTISPLFMIPFVKSLKFGLVFNSIAIIVFSFVKIIPKLFFGLQLFPFEVTKENSIEIIKQSFMRSLLYTDQYINIFILGIIVGYFLRKRPLLINKLTKTKLSIIKYSIISYSLSILAIVWSENFKDVNQEKNQLNLIAWYDLGNFLWSAGIIWTIFLFYQTKKGPLYWIMSSRLFNALIKMSLSILVNFGIINGLLAFMKRDTVVTSHINQAKIIYIDMTLTIIASYLVYVLIEYPIIRLVEIFTNRIKVILFENKSKINENNGNNEETDRMFE